MHKNKIVFDGREHKYTVDGIVRPSVTQILSSVGRMVKGRMAPICDNTFCQDQTASDFGKAFHKVAAMRVMGNDCLYPDEMRPWVTQFDRWYDDMELMDAAQDDDDRPLVEYPMYHPLLNYCGTPDLVAVLDGICYVVDYKTSTSEMGYWRYQTAAYAELVKVNLPHLVRGHKIYTMSVKFEEDTFKPHTSKMWHKDFNFFLSCFNVMKG